MVLCVFYLQENRPVGTSVLQLSVSDRDASHNGPPFSFSIVSGNEDHTFDITSQGALVSIGTLSRRNKDNYVLEIQVRVVG